MTECAEQFLRPVLDSLIAKTCHWIHILLSTEKRLLTTVFKPPRLTPCCSQNSSNLLSNEDDCDTRQ